MSTAHRLTAADLLEACDHVRETTGLSLFGCRLAVARGDLDLALRLLRRAMNSPKRRFPDPDPGPDPDVILARVAQLPVRDDLPLTRRGVPLEPARKGAA